MAATTVQQTNSAPRSTAATHWVASYIASKGTSFSSLIDDDAPETMTPGGSTDASGKTATAKSLPAKKHAIDDTAKPTTDAASTWLQDQSITTNTTPVVPIVPPINVPAGSAISKNTETIDTTPLTNDTTAEMTASQTAGVAVAASLCTGLLMAPIASASIKQISGAPALTTGASLQGASAQAANLPVNTRIAKFVSSTSGQIAVPSIVSNETTPAPVSNKPQVVDQPMQQQPLVQTGMSSGPIADAPTTQAPDNTVVPSDNTTQSLIADLTTITSSNSSSNLPDKPDGTAAGLLAASGITGGNAISPLLAGLAVTAGAGVSDIGASPSDQTSGATAQAVSLPSVQVALSISRNVTNTGSQNFTMQLKPESLGKVEVKLEISASGQATATFKADRPETLHLLQHDSQHLLAALQEAGINADTTDLNFSLNDKPTGQDSGTNQQSATNERNWNSGYVTTTQDTPAPTRTIASNRLYDIQA